MLKNYFKIAYRNLFRNKVLTSINVLGLALGMVCVLFILQWVWDETSIDRFHEKGNRLYRVIQEVQWDSGSQVWKSTPAPLLDVLQEEIPEIEKVAKTTLPREVTVMVGDKVAKINGMYASQDFLKMFTFPLLKGNAETALAEPGQMVVSQHFAEHYFPGVDPIGQSVRVDGAVDYEVTGVLAGIPSNSSVQFDFLLPQVDYEKGKDWLHWGNAMFYTYVLLRSDATKGEVDPKIADIININSDGDDQRLFLESVENMYLYDTYVDGKQSGGRIVYVYLFSAIALFVLLIACINFMNLATAKSVHRAQEVGIRKTSGAGRFDLIAQFIGEAMVTVLIAMALALLSVGLLQPYFNELTGKSLALTGLSFSHGIVLLAITFITGILAGSYPAFFLSSLMPVQSIKGSTKLGPGSTRLRKTLVVFQFALTMSLMVAAGTVYLQIQYVQQKNPGYDRENLLISSLSGDLYQKREVLKEQLLRSPAIQSATFTANHPHNIQSSSGDLAWADKPEGQTVDVAPLSVGYDFLETMKISLKSGRSFSPEHASDSTAYIINQAAAKLMEMEDPIGQEIDFWMGKGPIIGLVEDFHFTSMHQQIKPLVIMLIPENASGILIRTEAGRTQEAILALEQAVEKVSPGLPLEYGFLDELYGQLYKSEQLVGTLAWVATGFVVFISCLGLFGLALFTAEQRTKEIGIRKVMGASVGSLVVLLSRDFLKLVVIGFVLAVPVGLYAINRWLDSFAYRIETEWWMFGLAGLTMMGIALLTVSSHAVRAALANPVDSLKSE